MTETNAFNNMGGSLKRFILHFSISLLLAFLCNLLRPELLNDLKTEFVFAIYSNCDIECEKKDLSFILFLLIFFSFDSNEQLCYEVRTINTSKDISITKYKHKYSNVQKFKIPSLCTP